MIYVAHQATPVGAPRTAGGGFARIMKEKSSPSWDYQIQDGLADYGFAIEFQPDTGWRVYIICQPFYHSHDATLQLPSIYRQ